MTDAGPYRRSDDPLSRRPSRDLRPLLALAPYLARYRGRIAVALIALVIASSATLMVPAAVQRMVDLGFAPQHQDAISSYFLGLMGIAIILALATAVRFFYVTWIGERVVADLRNDVYAHVIGLSPAFFEITRTGEVLSRLTTDTTLIQSVVGSSASVALRNALILVGGVVMMFVTAPRLALAAFIVVPVTVLSLIAFGRRVRSLSRASQDRIADSSATAGETLNAIQIVQAFAREDLERRKFSETVERSFETAIRRTRARSLLTFFVIAFVFAAVVALLWNGSNSVAGGGMSSGNLTQFILYAVFVAGGVGNLAEIWGELQRAAGASERLVELLRIPVDIATSDDPVPLPSPPRGEVRFDDVTFTYPARPERSALHGVSMDIAPGETIAFVGPSGAGKSTLFQLLLRFRDPDSGRVLVDGVDIRMTDPQRLREALGLVPQDTVLFSGTVRDNIRYGRPDASDEDVIAAAKVAAAHDFIADLPQGYDTELGERGTRLSGGQRQRVAIARAIVKNPPILLLDEATSSLDTESERLIQQAFETLRRGRTTLVIAHRLSTVQRADRIVVLDEGRIVEMGTHEALVHAGGLYARLAALQFSESGLLRRAGE